MNRFGEFYPASVNIEMMDVYRPACNGDSGLASEPHERYAP